MNSKNGIYKKWNSIIVSRFGWDNLSMGFSNWLKNRDFNQRGFHK